MTVSPDAVPAQLEREPSQYVVDAAYTHPAGCHPPGQYARRWSRSTPAGWSAPGSRNVPLDRRPGSAGTFALGAGPQYERQMLDYGFRAVAASHRNAVLAGSRSRLRRTAARTAPRVIDRIPPVERRMMA